MAGFVIPDSVARGWEHGHGVPPEERAVTYAERPSGVPHVVAWTKSVATAGRILPDGCLDLLWDGTRLTVAGPDTRARWHASPIGTSYAALRMAAGAGPALLGVPADEIRDQHVPLDVLWSSADVRRLTQRVAEGGAAALVAWATARRTRTEPDPLGGRVLAFARAGAPVADLADRLGLSPRQLHRRCLPVFGYGPRHLSRVLRLQRALAAPGPLAEVAHVCGYADQAHLSREVRDLTGTTPSQLRRELGG
jgi:AraC-like DNA-binding protein